MIRSLRRTPSVTLLLAGFVVLSLMAGCRQDMHDQARHEPLEGSDFFEDGRASRPLVAGTVPRGHLRDDDHFYTGLTKDGFRERFPFSVTLADLERGRVRYDVFCAPCHDRVGRGEGMIVRRGFQKPRSFHEPELRARPVGYFYDVITRGYGAMADYASQIPPRDRWNIVAYLRALQRSQHARPGDVPPEKLEKLRESE